MKVINAEQTAFYILTALKGVANSATKEPKEYQFICDKRFEFAFTCVIKKVLGTIQATITYDVEPTNQLDTLSVIDAYMEVMNQLPGSYWSTHCDQHTLPFVRYELSITCKPESINPNP